MANCKLCASCFFFNELVSDMSQTMKYLKDKYCNGEFTKCTRFRISMSYGRDNVPTYIYPNDFMEISNTY